MPVNLLPQTPPPTPPGAKAPEGADDAVAPSFGASLSAARATAKGDAKTGPDIDAPRRTAKADADQDPVAAVDALALLGLPAAVPIPTAPAMTPVDPLANGRTQPSGEAPRAKGASVADLATTLPRSTAQPLRDALAGAPALAPLDAKGVVEASPKPEPKDAIGHPAAEASVTQRQEWREALAAALGTAATAARADLAKAASTDKVDAQAVPRMREPVADTSSPLIAPPSTSAPRAVQIEIATPALTPAWRDEVAQQIAQLVLVRQDRAEIRVHPQDLGPISVQIQFDGNSANLLIQAPQPATRDALDMALPQLRDALAQQGIALGQASVRDEGGAGADPSHRGPDPTDRTVASAAGADPVRVVPLRTPLGLVDLFA